MDHPEPLPLLDPRRAAAAHLSADTAFKFHVPVHAMLHGATPQGRAARARLCERLREQGWENDGIERYFGMAKGSAAPESWLERARREAVAVERVERPSGLHRVATAPPAPPPRVSAPVPTKAPDNALVGWLQSQLPPNVTVRRMPGPTREEASRGGQVAHARGHAHSFTREEAAAAGRKSALARAIVRAVAAPPAPPPAPKTVAPVVQITQVLTRPPIRIAKCDCGKPAVTTGPDGDAMCTLCAVRARRAMQSSA